MRKSFSVPSPFDLQDWSYGEDCIAVIHGIQILRRPPRYYQLQHPIRGPIGFFTQLGDAVHIARNFESNVSGEQWAPGQVPHA